MHKNLAVSVIVVALALTFFLLQPARADICCLMTGNDDGDHCVSVTSPMSCTPPNKPMSDPCNKVTTCLAQGKCMNTRTSDCLNLTRMACNEKYGDGYRFFLNQTCEQNIGRGSCCYEPYEMKPVCEDGLTAVQCDDKHWTYAPTPCNQVSKCMQAIAGEPTPKQPDTSIKFIPNVPIPGSEFSGTTAVDVDSTLFARYLGAFYVYFIGVIGILAVVMMMWGGFHYITAAGNPTKMAQGKETINGSIIGLILALTSFLLLRTVNPALVSFSGIFPSYIAQQLQSFGRSSEPLKSYDCQRKMSNEMPRIMNRVREGQYDQKIKAEASKAEYASLHLDSLRLLSILAVESSGVPTRQSNIQKKDGTVKHACGLMQVVPDSVPGTPYTCEQLKDPDTGIKVGVKMYASFQENVCYKSRNKYCREQPACDPTDPKYVDASYNGGFVANFCSPDCKNDTVWECEQSNAHYAETRCYVQAVQDAYNWLKANNVVL